MTATSWREYRELGDVMWLRDYDVALARAAERGRPVLLLFQEIPGCSTCLNFGHDVLANPLLVELIEDRFVAVAIHNNRPGKDAEILHRFSEPAWNNPVVYFLHADGQQILPKLADRYDPLGLYQKILSVLEALGQDVPDYFRLLRDDLMIDYGLAKSAVFETPCFWSGETTLAQHPAILTTEAGWIDGDEVVRVWFDPRVADARALADFARAEGFSTIAATGFRSDEAPQYYLSKSRFAHLALSPAQRSKINLAIPYQDRPERYLSPRQADWFARPEIAKISPPDTYRETFQQQWERLRVALDNHG